MYNVFQFASRKLQQEREARREREQQEYHLKHEQYKRLAYHNLQQKTEDFIARVLDKITQELSQGVPSVVEDDHFRSWRNHHIFRDIQDPNKFKGDKAFKHRPNEDMISLYSERQRKQRRYLVSKKEQLVKNGLIPKEHLSRSMASQGPYQPKIEFRQNKKYVLQPRLRYANVTDEQRLSESDMCFDERLRSIYRKFQQKKLKAGRQTKSSVYYLPNECNYSSEGDLKTTKSMSMGKSSARSINQPEAQGSSAMSSSQLSSKKTKTYFKLAQMMEMFHPSLQKRVEVSQLVKKCQLSRKKDLSNIRSNCFHQNYQKRPIL